LDHYGENKTDILWWATSRWLHQMPQIPTCAGYDYVMTARSMQDLFIYLHADASMITHVTKSASSCFAALRDSRTLSCDNRSPTVSLALWRLATYVSRFTNCEPACMLLHLWSRTENLASEMTYIVSDGTLNSAYWVSHGTSRASCHFFVACTGCEYRGMSSTNCQFPVAAPRICNCLT